MGSIIEVEHLKKSFGTVEAVRDISFRVESGRLFAFLGPNGAGKSTTIDMLCTFLRPDGGTARINGYPLGGADQQIRRSIGVVFQDGLLDGLMTVEENLRCRGALYGMKGRLLAGRVEAAMAAARITECAKRPYGKLSGGQKRRCDIARALLHTPEILFLDEPTTGLDPQTRKAVWDTIRSLQRDHQTTIFLTTHYMEEAAAADDVIVIDDGLIAAQGSPSELRESYASDQLHMTCANPAAVAAILDAGRFPYTLAAGTITVRLRKTLDALPLLQRCEPYLSAFEVKIGTMDEAFLAITGKELRQ